MLDHLTDLGVAVATDVATALAHNWPFLLASVVVASVVQVYVKPDRVGSWLRRRTWAAASSCQRPTFSSSSTARRIACRLRCRASAQNRSGWRWRMPSGGCGTSAGWN